MITHKEFFGIPHKKSQRNYIFTGDVSDENKTTTKNNHILLHLVQIKVAEYCTDLPNLPESSTTKNSS